MKGLFAKLATTNVALLTVMSFVITSLLGGVLLTWTEGGRTVTASAPIVAESMLILSDQQSAQLNGITNLDSIAQTNTYIKKIQYSGERFIDMWFTSVSALCVTGLTSTDFSQFTLAGQIIVMILIQMGGLGIIFFTSILALLVMRGLSENVTIRSLMASLVDTGEDHVWHMVKHILYYTLFFEGLAFLIMGAYLQRGPYANVLSGTSPWWRALFHSISAFNNAGFGLFNDNLVKFVADPVINLTIASLIIVGGLGYPVLMAIHVWIRKMIVHHNDKAQEDLDTEFRQVMASPVQMKIAIWGTVGLIIVGMVIPFMLDGGSLSNYTTWEQLLIHFFHSVSTRTAGFNTIDISILSYATLFLYIGLMFVGANPAGTAGGIKITTLGVLYGYLKDWFGKPGEPVRLFGGSISKYAVSHAVRLFFFSIIFCFGIAFCISILEQQYLHTNDTIFTFFKVMFETVSAFGTVGLSMGYPGSVTSFAAILHPLSKFLLIVAMLFGRMGPLTVLTSIAFKKQEYESQASSGDFDNVEKIQIG